MRDLQSPGAMPVPVLHARFCQIARSVQKLTPGFPATDGAALSRNRVDGGGGFESVAAPGRL